MSKQATAMADTRGYPFPSSRALWARVYRGLVRLRRLGFRSIDDLVYVRDLSRPLPELRSDAGSSGYLCRPLHPSDQALLVAALGAAKADELVKRLEIAVAVVAISGQELAGYSWMTTKIREREGEAPFLYRIAPPTDWTYGFDTYVLPRFRGRGVAAALKTLQMELARTGGGKFFYVTHDRDNHSVIRLSERLGFTQEGVLTYRRVLGVARINVGALPRGEGTR